MPVFNVLKSEPVDLSFVTPLSITGCDTESYVLSTSGINPNSLNYSYADHMGGGEIVNDPLSSGKFYIFATSQGIAPTRAEVLSMGTPLFPGGSYSIQQRGDFSLYLATDSENTRMIGHYYKVEN